MQIFFTCQTWWQSFRRENLTVNVSLLLMQWQDSIWSGEIPQPILSKIFNIFSSSTSPLTSRGVSTMPRHSRLEFRAFTQHFCSKITNLLGNNVLTFFVTDSSEFSLVIVSDKLRTSSRTLLVASLLASSNFLCKDKAIGIRSWLRSLSSESLVYHYIKYARIRVFTDPYYPVCSVWCYISVR